MGRGKLKLVGVSARGERERERKTGIILWVEIGTSFRGGFSATAVVRYRALVDEGSVGKFVENQVELRNLEAHRV